MKDARRKRRRKIFFMALAALIFAEAGYILGTTGLIHLLPLSPTHGAGFGDVVEASEGYVFFGGNITRGAPLYDTTYVYILPYRTGQRLSEQLLARITLDAAERPVYILPAVQAGYVDPADFIDLPKDLRNPVVLLYPKSDRWYRVVADWLQAVATKLNIGDLPARVTLEGGNAVAWVKV
ncbi:MAG: hypothetical protein ACK4SY_05330 [Pyrobaculum sp.]